MKVSVIIPVYHVESYIERCVRSLMEQTLKDVEFIFVDDASPDSSMDIVRRVVAEYNRDVTILVHETNRGLPAARNSGLAIAKGEYIYHCDSDDYLEMEMLDEMFSAVASSGAEYAYCDYYLDFGTSSRSITNPSYTNPMQMVKEGFLSGAMKYNVWNKLVRKDLYDVIMFPEGHSMGEDMTMIPLALKARRVCPVSRPLYHYSMVNQSALSKSFSLRKWNDITFNLERTLSLMDSWRDLEKEKYIAFFKLNIKLPLLFSCDADQYRLWKMSYPEANSYILSNKFLPIRTRMVQLLAKWNLFFLVKVYGWAVNNLFYGLFYKK